ncbi:hypothetical protein HAX54_017723 [Datura stramonium]|uniref:Replication protein A 14 kDa subunit B-like n=1 Tax=Datura stramonium TaxID=4076 RepID=A0ABS8S0W9_DATST|nr:hypothetical protein [Datura stramonium]
MYMIVYLYDGGKFCRHIRVEFFSFLDYSLPQILFIVEALIIHWQDMDTSNPAVFVNAEFLKEHVGRRVRTVVQVVQSDGDKVIGKSTDEKQLVVKGYPPNPLSTFVEVIGIADTTQSIQAETWTNFGDTLDVISYDKVCRLANGDHKHLFI